MVTRRRGRAGRGALIALLGLVVLAGCARGVRQAAPPPARLGAEQEGIASWYGEPYHGRTTASGEIYDMHALTAAHRTLPFGTRVAVTNLDNGRRVEVRVNDRGPFREGRIVDVSLAAARHLGMVLAGIVPVRLRVLALPGLPGEDLAREEVVPATAPR
jgi:rare lipoprotein A